MKPPPAAMLLGAIVLSAPAPAPSPTPASPGTAISRFASYGGYRVHYESVGAGRSAVVFVHGLACDSTSWRFQVPALAARSRLVLIDLPGHGRSDRPERFPYTLRSHALALETVLREAGVDRAILVGHSMGTAVAREFYRLYPQRTTALVAVDGALKPMIQDRAAVEKFVEPYRGPEFPARAEKFVESMLPSRADAPPWGDDIRSRMLSTPQAVFVHSLEGLLDPAAWKDDPVRVPLLCVVAEDRSTRHRSARSDRTWNTGFWRGPGTS